MVRILVAGATGLVGRHVIARALADARIDRVVAPTRRPIDAHAKLDNPVINFSRLPAEADWGDVDGVICVLGTTRAKAGSDEAFREVDYDYPLQIAQLTHRHGAKRFALNSSLGADARSRLLYPRTKGEIEQAIKAIGFPSLTIVRPGLIGGDRDEFRLGERMASVVLKALAPILPRRYRISPAEKVAEALIEAAVAGRDGIHLIEAETLAAD